MSTFESTCSLNWTKLLNTNYKKVTFFSMKSVKTSDFILSHKVSFRAKLNTKIMVCKMDVMVFSCLYRFYLLVALPLEFKMDKFYLVISSNIQTGKNRSEPIQYEERNEQCSLTHQNLKSAGYCNIIYSWKNNTKLGLIIFTSGLRIMINYRVGLTN